MLRVTPLTKDQVPELADGFAKIEAMLGFVPNSNLIMARRPELLKGFQAMAVGALAPGTVPMETKFLIAHLSSRTAGCNYCIAHTGHMSETKGVDPKKIDALWDYETSSLFTPAERAALVVAQGASQVPNAVTDADFDELKRHWDDDQIVEIVGVIAMYGFLNRWNDTLATELERDPTRYGRERLEEKGWSPGKHAATEGTNGN